MAFNILVVDDSTVMRAMVIKTLRMSGIEIGEIYQAANGQDGLERLHEHWVDLVMLDISMPVMRGEVMVERLRAYPEFANLPVIVVSSERSEERVAQMAAMGAVFVHKPFTPEQLRAVILNVTGATDESSAREFAPAGSDFDF